GGKLTLIDSADGKFTATDLRDTILGEETRGVHGPQRGPVSITQLTELGTAYQLDEIKDICAVAKAFDLPVHLDGARFANALTALGCTPAEMTWKAGVDAVSFGGTKNGLMGVEAVIFFDPKHAWEFELRRKRGAHLFSKHRYLSTQMETYLTDDLWLETAKSANDAARYFADELAKSDSVEFDHPVDGNMIFAKFPRAAHQRLQDAGAVYYVWEGALEGDNPDALLTARLVCDWNTSKDAIDAFVAHI
ncbi:MAG: threonine aldolase family protein, partial [Halocynthiibacter sp.]